MDDSPCHENNILSRFLAPLGDFASDGKRKKQKKALKKKRETIKKLKKQLKEAEDKEKRTSNRIESNRPTPNVNENGTTPTRDNAFPPFATCFPCNATVALPAFAKCCRPYFFSTAIPPFATCFPCDALDSIFHNSSVLSLCTRICYSSRGSDLFRHTYET